MDTQHDREGLAAMTDNDESSDLTAIQTFRSVADAQIAKGILDEARIDSMIRSDNAGGMYPAIAGADLLVRAEDAQKARNALDTPRAG
jgi:hypothetical protein